MRRSLFAHIVQIAKGATVSVRIYAFAGQCASRREAARAACLHRVTRFFSLDGHKMEFNAIGIKITSGIPAVGKNPSDGAR